MRTRISKTIGLKLLGAALVLSLHGSPVQANWYSCHSIGEAWCPNDYGCFGEGYAYTQCAVWCYNNEGQTFVGYADCLS